MKETLYLVAMRSKHTGKAIVFISTSDYTDSSAAAVLKVIDYEYEVDQSEAEIEAILDDLEGNEIDSLKARLKELGAA